MIGAVDGKHVILQQPCNSGSHYRNYKGTDSIILMAVVGPEYQFLFADVGMNGRNSDGGNWLQSPMRKALEKNTLSLPKPKPLHENRKETPFVWVGDDAFPLTNYLMKPYPQKDLTINNRIFNYLLSRARRISESAFGILANCWRVLRKPFSLQPEKVKIITFAILILHNWLRSESSSGRIYVPPNLIDVEDLSNDEIIYGDWRSDVPTNTWFDLQPSYSRNATKQAKEIREEFKDHFMKEGSVPWQWRSAQIIS